eukprot:scaffold25355_cov19-Cyclotella_meneghiniana.AAC.1
MNRPYQPTPLSCYRIDSNLLCASPRGHTSEEADTDILQDCLDPRPLIERFELLVDDHDEDSIFTESEDKGEKAKPSQSGARTKMDVNALSEEMSSPFKGRQSRSDGSNLDEVNKTDGDLAYEHNQAPFSRPNGSATQSSRTQSYETFDEKQPSSMELMPFCESTSQSSTSIGDILSMNSYDS